MGKSDPPPPPDPRETAAAQTAQNVGTSIANNTMQMVDQRTPYGTLTYEQTGTYEWEDPNSGGNQFGVSYATPVSSQGTSDDGQGVVDFVDPHGTGTRRDGSVSRASGQVVGTPQIMQQQRQTYQIPRYTATVTLPEDQQAALDAQFASNRALSETALERSQFLKEYLPEGMDLSGLPEARGSEYVGNLDLIDGISDAGAITRTYGTDFSEDRQRVEDALMQRMEPYLQQNRDRISTALANKGINSGSEAYGYEMGYLGQRENDARMSAILSAGEEQSRLTNLERDRSIFENQSQAQQFGQNAQSAAFTNATRESEQRARMANANLDNALRTQRLNEEFAIRNQPLNEIAALLANSQVQNPNLQPITPGAMPTTDYAGIVSDNYNQQLGAWNAQNSNSQSLMGGLLGLGGNIIMASDARLKRNVSKVAEVNGLSIVDFQYVWGGPTHRGYIAQEVAEKWPQAVLPIGQYMAVDYGMLPEISA